MINAQMRQYNYYTYSPSNEYGQEELTKDPQGTIKVAINILTQNVENSILYSNCSYIGLTTDAEVNDTYVIEYGKERLKVLYIQPQGLYKQLFLQRM